MASQLMVERYREQSAKEWDRFVQKESINGSFLQERRFLSYHPDGRFQDSSLIVRRGNNIVAVVSACECMDEGKKLFYSHGGSTFGGIVLGVNYASVSKAIEIVRLVTDWIKENGFQVAMLKQTSSFLSACDMSFLEYALQHEGYAPYGEISFVINFDESYPVPVESNFTASRRRDCRYGAKAGLSFRRLESDDQVACFYEVLKLSLQKFDAKPVHTLEELLDFKNQRLVEEVRFYGVYLNDQLIAGSMVFVLRGLVFHTQYLAAHPDYLDLFPMNYMDWNLIALAQEEGFKKFSFGISTEEHGRVLNATLASFKEGFGGTHSMNWTFTKEL